MQEVIKLQKHKILYSKRFRFSAGLFAIVILFIALSCFKHSNNTNDNILITQMQIEEAASSPNIVSEPHKTEQEPDSSIGETVSETNVYIMPTGTVYHKADCRYVVEDRATEITITEAEKIGRRPCKVCEP